MKDGRFTVEVAPEPAVNETENKEAAKETAQSLLNAIYDSATEP